MDTLAEWIHQKERVEVLERLQVHTGGKRMWSCSLFCGPDLATALALSLIYQKSLALCGTFCD